MIEYAINGVEYSVDLKAKNANDFTRSSATTSGTRHEAVAAQRMPYPAAATTATAAGGSGNRVGADTGDPAVGVRPGLRNQRTLPDSRQYRRDIHRRSLTDGIRLLGREGVPVVARRAGSSDVSSNTGSPVGVHLDWAHSAWETLQPAQALAAGTHGYSPRAIVRAEKDE
ncbi:hypothetical protein ABIB34_004435 [Rhodococcus sp. UYP5]